MKKIFNLFGTKLDDYPEEAGEVTAMSDDVLVDEGLVVHKSVASAPMAEMPMPAPMPPVMNERVVESLSSDIEESQARAVSELGERHELIAARLDQVAEILLQLNDAHKLVEHLSVPMADLFRQHQAMASNNIALQHLLDRNTSEIGLLRDRESKAVTRVASLEMELKHTSDSCVQFKALQETAEEKLRVATSELRVRDATIAELEQQMHEIAVDLDNLKDDLAEANMRLQESDAAQNALNMQLRQEREDHHALEREYESLQMTVQNTVAEVTQMSRRLAEAEDMTAASRTHALQVEAMLNDVQSEKNKLLEQMNEMEQAINEERRNLEVKAEGMRGRSVTLKKLLTQTREELANQAEALREALRKGTEMNIAINRLESKSEKALAALAKSEEEKQRIEQARLTLVERVEMMTKGLRAKEASLKRSEDVSDNLTQRLSQLEERSSNQAEAYERHIAELSASLEREKIERALLEGALEAVRQEKGRLQRELIHYRTSLVDDSLVEMPSRTAETPADNVASIYAK